MNEAILRDGAYSDRLHNAKWKTQWERYVWYSKSKDQIILSDSLYRTWTCNQKIGNQCFSSYVLPSYVYVGEL